MARIDRRTLRTGILAVLIPAGFTGCLYGSHPAPVDARHAALDRANISPDALAPIHVVSPGDTLYSIAWQSRRDFRDLARWNQISPPYRIQPGQRIRLASVGMEKTVSAPSETSGDDIPEVIPLGTTNTTPAASSAPSPAAAGKTKAPAKAALTPEPAANQPVTTWLWPAAGKHRRMVSVKKGMDGVEISGKKGQPVKATANGNVVYEGSGILGLGRLVIIKHNDTYLSAYAHNAEILVKEGERVRQGQTIAKMGDTDASKVALYFEIRKNGKPVNPLKFLAGR